MHGYLGFENFSVFIQETRWAVSDQLLSSFFVLFFDLNSKLIFFTFSFVHMSFFINFIWSMQSELILGVNKILRQTQWVVVVHYLLWCQNIFVEASFRLQTNFFYFTPEKQKLSLKNPNTGKNYFIEYKHSLHQISIKSKKIHLRINFPLPPEKHHSRNMFYFIFEISGDFKLLIPFLQP